MSIEFIPNLISSGYNLAKINDNFDKIQLALQDALSRSGGNPNQMNADLDMNGNNILNITGIGAESIIIDGQTAEEFLREAAEAATDEAESFAADAEASAISASNSSISALGYATASANSFAGAQTLVQQATAGFLGFIDGLSYDFGSITTSTTYFNQDWGSVA